MDARFKWFFPENANEIPREASWRQLQHYDTFLNWQAFVAQNGDIQALRQKFEQMIVFPSGTARSRLFRIGRENGRSCLIFSVMS
jgi:hypothetical protein